MPGRDTPEPGSITDVMDVDAAGRVLASLMEGGDEEREGASAGCPSISGYVFEARLGGGGGGEVYRAYRAGSERPLAVKVLRHRLDDSAEATRAWRELDVLGQVRLPCVPRLVDYGVCEGRMYIATEYVQGRALDAHCAEAGLDREGRVRLLVKVAEAVQALHERGVIHRDIKPSNVLVTPSGDPVLIDLGIAVLLSGEPMETLTREGSPIGSPAFMAPEQARGERSAVSTRSDVYGLGATAYVVLTGKTPHDMDATLHEAVRRVAQDEPRFPRALDPGLPKALSAVLMKAVARRGEDRYASAVELAEDLQRWLRREPVEAGERSLLQRAGAFLAHHPIMLTAAICVTIAVLTLVATYVSVLWVNARPYRVMVDPVDQSWAAIESYSGRRLHVWGKDSANAVRFGALVDRAQELGGRRVAVIGFSPNCNEPEVKRRLCIFELGDLKQPCWASGITRPEITMPPPISTVEGHEFTFSRAIVADVFNGADAPGVEIVATHAHMPHSAYAIRVYDVQGEILYEVWHDGMIAQLHWDDASGLLICCGLSSEASWRDRGHTGEGASRSPMVVFAVRPERGQINRAWIRTPGGAGRFEPVWYLGVAPPKYYQYLSSGPDRFRLGPPSESVDDRGCVRVTLSGDVPPHVTVNIDLDATGERIYWYTGDAFEAEEGLPTPEDFRICALPAIVRSGE